MKEFCSFFADSLANFKKTKSLALCGILIAFTTAVSLFSIPIVKGVSFSFKFIFTSMIAFLFGPIMAFSAGLITDILSFLVKSDGYVFDPRYTILEGFALFIYAIFLYKRDSTSRYFIINIFWAKFSVNLIVNIIFGTWRAKGYLGHLSEVITVTRIYKNIICLPIEILMMFFVLRFVDKVWAKHKNNNNANNREKISFMRRDNK